MALKQLEKFKPIPIPIPKPGVEALPEPMQILGGGPGDNLTGRPAGIRIPSLEDEVTGLFDTVRRLYPDALKSYLEISDADYPAFVINTIFQRAEADPDTFLRDQQTKGRNPDTETLVRAIGGNDKDIEGFLIVGLLELPLYIGIETGRLSGLTSWREWQMRMNGT